MIKEFIVIQHTRTKQYWAGAGWKKIESIQDAEHCALRRASDFDPTLRFIHNSDKPYAQLATVRVTYKLSFHEY